MATYHIASLDVQDNGNLYRLSNGIPYGVCETGATIAAKTVNLDPALPLLTAGATIHVKFTNSNTAESPTLSVDGFGSLPLRCYGAQNAGKTAETSWNSGAVVTLTYDGSGWVMNDWLNTVTEIVPMTEVEIQRMFEGL